MGKLLQIRVQASTYSEDDVSRAWPRLFELAFSSQAPVPSSGMRGVMELVARLDDIRRFSDGLPNEVKAILDKNLPPVLEIRDELESSLADWKAARANTLSDDLEKAIADLETMML